MKIIHIDQGSPEWKQWRRSHITGTDAAVILDLNPWRSIFQLYEDKLRMVEDIVPNDAMLRGTQLEPEARDLFNQMNPELHFKPCVIESSEYPWMGSSLDGISPCGRFICEIKCPKAETHEMAINGDVPFYYQVQCQHGLMCSGASFCFYISYMPEHPTEKIAWVVLERNEAFFERMIALEHKFWSENLCMFKPPIPDWVFEAREAKKQLVA